MTDAAAVYVALDALGLRPRWRSQRELRSGCPLHQSRSRTCLSVRAMSDGLAVRCHQCDATNREILAALGLAEALPRWPPIATRATHPPIVPEPLPDLEQCERALYAMGRDRFLRETRRLEPGVMLNHRIGWCAQRSAYVLPLTDVRAGFWSFERPVRGAKFYEPSTGNKWMTKGTPSGSILFGQLPHSDAPLRIVEGELDALAVLSNGDPITFRPAGAVSPCDGARIPYRPRPEFIKFLRPFSGRLFVVGDNDAPGNAYRAGWSEALKAARIPHHVAEWTGPGPGGGERLKHGFDVTDEVRDAA